MDDMWREIEGGEGYRNGRYVEGDWGQRGIKIDNMLRDTEGGEGVYKLTICGGRSRGERYKIYEKCIGENESSGEKV